MLKKLIVSGLVLGLTLCIPVYDVENSISTKIEAKTPQQAQKERADAKKFYEETVSHGWRHVSKDGYSEYLSAEEMRKIFIAFSPGHEGWIDLSTGCFRGWIDFYGSLNIAPNTPLKMQGRVTIDNWTVMTVDKAEVQYRKLDYGTYYRDDNPNY